MKDIENIDSIFLKDAINSRKWAFATDFLRFYIIYNYGGIYLDSDIYVYRSFDRFLSSKGFTSLEGSGILRCEKKKSVQDFGLEAALFGAEKHSLWIKNILDFYKDLRFKNTSEFCLSIIAPKVMWKQTVPFGLREVPSFQRLDNDILIFPLDTFSCVADYQLYGISNQEYHRLSEINPLRYACHLCSNSWGWAPRKNVKDKIKEIIVKIMGRGNAVKIKRFVKSLNKGRNDI